MMPLRMRRWPFVASFFAGLALLTALLPLYDAALPRGLAITRGQARVIADAEAVKWGIPAGTAFAVTTWEDSDILEKELGSDAARRRLANADSVVGPRLGGYKVVYFRYGVEKFPEYGTVVVGVHGEILWARRMARAEETGAAPGAGSLRPKADAFVASRVFPGAPSPVFESVRPTVLQTRTDHLFRYRVATTFPTGDVAFYLGVYFIGDQPSGWR